MTTIRMVDPGEVSGKVKDVFDAVLRRERTVFGATAVSNIWRCMGHSAELVEANWHRSRALMQRGHFTPLGRELIATAVSMANACHYWIDSHVAAVMRLGIDEVGVTELMGVTEHARAMATTSAALLLESLADESGLIAPLPHGHGDDAVQALLAEVSAWTQTAMGRTSIPAVWRILAHNPHYLEATWRKDVALMAAGALSERDKRRVALGVAMAGRARYMIEYHTAVLRHGGDADRDLLEILGVVDHYTTLNTLSEAMQIESDIRPLP